ncbi:Uu.00g119180.m01.CDS01 [Anthostomella pinea]|uniref:Altered inheritance of mitochondria protein 11 n=1 Tax=Anthostomella pinea TaxID=933095 RepID=A0AAI8VHL0_9PEZI|nr:Uu.00g119180.m01.CDS01 [Anthostomella pinea]
MVTIASDRDAAVEPTPSQPPSTPREPVPVAPPPPQPHPPILSQRSLKQLGLFFAGTGFLALSILITRRSVVRKIRATAPRFYTQSNRPVGKGDSDSSLIAFEALSLATLNMMSASVMVTGGLSWAFNISNIEDLRAKARGHVGAGDGKTDEEAEKQMEEWVDKILGRRDQQEQEANPPSKKTD